MASRAPISFSLNISANQIEILTGNNYKKWKADIELALNLLDIDIAIREDKPSALTATSTPEQKTYHKEWTRANSKALMLIKRAIDDKLVKAIPNSDDAKTFMASVGERYAISVKAEAGQLMERKNESFE